MIWFFSHINVIKRIRKETSSSTEQSLDSEFHQESVQRESVQRESVQRDLVQRESSRWASSRSPGTVYHILCKILSIYIYSQTDGNLGWPSQPNVAEWVRSLLLRKSERIFSRYDLQNTKWKLLELLTEYHEFEIFLHAYLLDW